MKWFNAAAEEILSGTEKVMDELDIIRVSKFIQMIFEPEESSISLVKIGGSGLMRAPNSLSCLGNFKACLTIEIAPLEKMVTK